MSTDAPSTQPGGDADGPLGPEGPRRFGHYLLLKELGRGAQGVVFLAEDANLHRKVALKMLTGAGVQSQVTRDRFRREAELTSKFEHPGICGVHDMGEVEGVPYIAMQYVRGTTLAAIVDEAREGSKAAGADAKASDTISIVGGDSKGGLEDVLRLVERAARALHVAHEAGLVHRDVKPANIMVTTEGHPVLLDFGLARDLESEGQALTQSGQILGTPAYLAPEQIVATRGTVDRRTDVYALGVTLFECLTLRRPFEAASWDQLFHEILDGAPRNPRGINPRIPKDLGTVIEVAMERDQARRYPTAEALAEDLRRVRSFEPITAKAAGPLARGRKWARRNPGRATGVAAAGLFLLLAGSMGTARVIERRTELRDQLAAARDALVAADYVAAAVAIAKAQELDPESPEVVLLKADVERARADAEREAERKKALAEADAARREAAELGASYAQARRRIDELGAQILLERTPVMSKFAPDEARAEYARLERDQQRLEVDAERMLLSRSEALERALRLEDPWGGPSDATQRALAAFYTERWREAVAEGDAVRAAAMRTAVELHDTQGEHEDELLGRGTLALAVAPAGADVFLFRFEPYESLREEAVIPRLVPVPTTGVGRTPTQPFPGGFVPGDPCLVVLEVEPGSPADRAGLRRGDLVLSVQGAPAASAVFVRAVAAGSALERAGVPPLARLTAVDGGPVACEFDWRLRAFPKPVRADAQEAAAPRARVSIEGIAEPVECDPRTVSVVGAADLLREATGVPLRLECLRAGEPLALDAPAGVRSGLTCEASAYPLVLAPANRVDAGEGRAMDPGSYLLFARAPGFVDQRFLVDVGRGEAAVARVELLPAGDVPDGFVYVPPGPYRSGGDPEAFQPRPGRDVDVPGFLLARTELTNREWYAFVNDPEVRARIDAAKPGEHLYLPQDDRVMARRDPDSGEWTWDVHKDDTADTPVLGLTWLDVRDYVAWRNHEAEQAGEPWRYELPTEDQWEKAARGVDGRAFPWGDRFDPSLTVCLVRQDLYLLDAPGGYELRDESPFGVRDLAGSREEWLRDAVEGSEAPLAYKRGGCWLTATEIVFRSASLGKASQVLYSARQGLRLVARRP